MKLLSITRLPTIKLLSIKFIGCFPLSNSTWVYIKIMVCLKDYIHFPLILISFKQSFHFKLCLYFELKVCFLKVRQTLIFDTFKNSILVFIIEIKLDFHDTASFLSDQVGNKNVGFLMTGLIYLGIQILNSGLTIIVDELEDGHANRAIS